MFVERGIKSAIADNALSMQKVKNFVDDPNLANKVIGEWDAAALLKLMWETWNEVFRKTLGHAERSLVSEVRDWRNKWGTRQGEARILTRRLQLKFGALPTGVEERIADADEEDLLRWSERVLTANRLEEVLH